MLAAASPNEKKVVKFKSIEDFKNRNINNATTTIIFPKQRRISSNFSRSSTAPAAGNRDSYNKRLSSISNTSRNSTHSYNDMSFRDSISGYDSRRFSNLSVGSIQSNTGSVGGNNSINLSFGSRRHSRHSSVSLPKALQFVSTKYGTNNKVNSSATINSGTTINNDASSLSRISTKTSRSAKAAVNSKSLASRQAQLVSNHKYERITNSLIQMFDSLQTNNQNKAQLIEKLQALKIKNAKNHEKLENLVSKIKQVESNFEIYDSKVDNDCTLIMICMCLIKNI